MTGCESTCVQPVHLLRSGYRRCLHSHCFLFISNDWEAVKNKWHRGKNKYMCDIHVTLCQGVLKLTDLVCSLYDNWKIPNDRLYFLNARIQAEPTSDHFNFQLSNNLFADIAFIREIGSFIFSFSTILIFLANPACGTNYGIFLRPPHCLISLPRPNQQCP